MAESYAQRKKLVNQALRRVRQAYRRADSKGEILERELDRLIDRKTVVTPRTIVDASTKFQDYVDAVKQIDPPFTDAYIISSQNT